MHDRSVYKPDYVNFFEDLETDMVEFSTQYEGARFMVAGDFNARTCTGPDFIESEHTENLLFPYFYSDDNELSRNNRDTAPVNDNGEQLLEFCHTTGLRIMNGRVGEDSPVGEYTYDGCGRSTINDILCSKVNF